MEMSLINKSTHPILLVILEKGSHKTVNKNINKANFFLCNET